MREHERLVVCSVAGLRLPDSGSDRVASVTRAGCAPGRQLEQRDEGGRFRLELEQLAREREQQHRLARREARHYSLIGMARIKRITVRSSESVDFGDAVLVTFGDGYRLAKNMNRLATASRLLHEGAARKPSPSARRWHG